MHVAENGSWRNLDAGDAVSPFPQYADCKDGVVKQKSVGGRRMSLFGYGHSNYLEYC